MKTYHILIFLFIVNISGAQVITVTGTTASGSGEALADDQLFDTPLIVIETNTLSNFTAGLYGNDYATFSYAHALDTGFMPKPHYVSSEFGSRAMINGNNTSGLTIKWKNTGHNYSSTDAHFARIILSMNFSVNMAVTGIPAGTAVTVYWWYDIFGGGNTSHEDPMLDEDSVRVINTMLVDGVSQFNSNQFSFGSPAGLPGWNEWKNKTGAFRATAGNNFTFSVSSQLFLHIDNPGEAGGLGFPVDQCNGIFRGSIFFTVVAQYPPPPANIDEMLTLFSLDIGSDSEMSDPQLNGNEVFDPGDMYAMSNIGPLPAVTPFLDDSLIFDPVDPDPKPFAPVNPAPVGSGMPVDVVQGIYFDLDGSDLLDFSLSAMTDYGPGFPSIPWFSDSCVFEAEYIFVSFDDDTPEHYVSLIPSVPVNSNSFVMNTIYADNGNQDEVKEFDYDPMFVSGPYLEKDLYSEFNLHQNLGPDPVVNNDFDDDVDALDMIPISGNNTPCTQWYISADHEATFNHPLLAPPYLLDPATVYEVSPTGPVPVITSIHHGLMTGTDMSDFEFAWVWDGIEGRYGLALLFTVAEDDTLTSDDETGGLNPRIIYSSFLNGTSQAYSSNQLPDDVDGLTVWKNSMNGTIVFPNPVWGTKTWTAAENEKWNNALNWFPQGVPFDPEDVTIPAISPSPVISTSGLDCKSIDVSSGATLIIKSNPFTIKGL